MNVKMTPNPLTRESEARREGWWVRVYAVPILLTAVFCGVGGYFAYLAYRSTHPKQDPVYPTPSNWLLYNQDHSIEVPGRVPGGVYTDLLSAGVLSDGHFYYRYNDINYRWVSKDNWTYSTTFDVDPKIIEHERVVLIFEGLDTVAEIFLNDVSVGNSDNMFIRYVFDVKNHLRLTEEEKLEVRFESPVSYANKAYEQQYIDYLVPPRCVPEQFQGECHANHIRKMQSSFSWDWGPAFPSMGIWKPWKLIGFDSLLISDVLFSAIPDEELPSDPDYTVKPGWDITLEVIFDAETKSGEVVGHFEISLGNISSQVIEATASIENFQATATCSFSMDEDLIDLWWPNGFGSTKRPQLYNLTVTWVPGTLAENSSKTIRVGFRTVELNQDLVDPNNQELGRHYRVLVNNVTMFMKGSNWIPAHVLPEQVTEEYTKDLLQAAADTHQNCLRVWGGGIYESDAFYEIADELGLLIWQDFMFACSMYPVNEPFLDSVLAEVETQVRRLHHHPSILLWAANNENEAALRDNWYGTQPDFETYKRDYKTLYVETIRNTTLSIDTSRPFVVSSPNNGMESEEEDFVAQNPYSNLYGDVHYYNYLSDSWNWKIYPPTRFASEYGFQSWPSFISMKNVTSEEDWFSSSSLSYHRQHHPQGQGELDIEIGLHMHLPLQDGSAKAYQDYLYLSQIHQAVAIKTESEFYRRGMSSINQNGEGYISGALYWQLNDIWQGASWASIEFGGRWKMLHYFVKKFFDSVIVSPFLDNDNLYVAIVNDQYEKYENLKLSVNLHRYDTFEHVKGFESIVTAEPMEANIIANYSLWGDLGLDEHCFHKMYDEVDVCFVVVMVTPMDGDDLIIYDNYLFLGKPKDASLPKANIRIESIDVASSNQTNQNTFTVNIRSDNVALFVWLEVDVPGTFSDNGFLITEETVDISFYASQDASADSLRETMTIKCLTDTYSVESLAAAKATAVMDRALHPNDIKNLLFV